MAKKRQRQSGGAPAASVAGPAVDPTRNVERLVEEGMKRQDDLREMDSRYQRDVSDREIRHIKEITDLRANCDDELRLGEAKRIDAIRAVDVGAVSRAAEVSSDAAESLRVTGVATAEAMRAQVEAARQQTAQALADALAPLTAAVSELRQVQFTQAGQTAQRAETKVDQRAGSGLLWVIIGLVVTVMFSLMFLLIAGLSLYLTLRRGG